MSQSPRTHLIGCESSFIAIKQKSHGKVEYRVFPTRCNKWDCKVCAKVKAKKYRDRMRPLFDGRKLWMYTLTYYHNREPSEVWREYSVAWNRFRTAAAKRYGSFAYCRVLEHHNLSPYPHLHIIADKEFKAVWMAAELKTAGFGYQAVCKPITSEGAIGYVTKYLSKPWTSENCKRYRRQYRLRIVSFGGGACRRGDIASDWEIVARNISCDNVNHSVCVDRDWTYDRTIKLVDRQVFDAFVKELYVLPDELTIIDKRVGPDYV